MIFNSNLHIDSVKNSEITTKVYEECIPVNSKYETEFLKMIIFI